ncbi:hypothetical protein ETD86_34385 [Nonomuraea turkmeniaca]|uniref:PH domain-containing protein n=1 Tax=Nonomuraea turkmeniaca TaxID=103838 RepID=A0A5S4FR58_9ACTN|nr:hypothetical protein [Nonomuraea turkmeniaca]TMR11897.1 hypothetical protein ETD86_34385 [Nonomuraea turkmeniaca]
MRILSVAALAFPVAVFLAPSWFNPTWEEGLPAGQWPWLTGIFVVLLVVTWAAFSARVELAGGHVRVVNPWGTQTFSAREVVDTGPGRFGLYFELSSGRKVAAFAIQCPLVSLGEEPRWVGVARAVAAARDAGRR